MTTRCSRLLFLRHFSVSGDTHCTSTACVWSLTVPLFYCLFACRKFLLFEKSHVEGSRSVSRIGVRQLQPEFLP